MEVTWKDKEPGPDCYCGDPTIVMIDEDGSADLLCLFHQDDSAALFPLPKVRPEKWPDLSLQEMHDLVELAMSERDDEEELL